MKARIVAAVVLWMLTAAWMTTIFLFSAQPAEESSAVSGSLTEWLVSAVTPQFDELSAAEQEALVENWHNIIRKIAHLTEYGILGALLVSSLLVSFVKTRLSAILAAIISLLYAISDEVHQLFIESRGPGVLDVFIDFTGAVVGVVAVLVGYRLVCTIRKKQKEKSN